MSSPYAPPEAPVRDPAGAKGSAIKAVLAGILVDTGGTLVASVILTMLYGATLVGSVASEEELQAQLSSMAPDSWVSVAGTLMGTVLSIAGGYLCARIARHSEYRLAAIVAACGAVVSFALGAGYYSAPLHVALQAVSIASVMLGAWLGIRRNARD